MAVLDTLSMTELGSALEDSVHPKKLAVLGLPWETNEETLREHFSQFGELEHAEVMKDRFTGKSRGFGFVTFAEQSGASAALCAEHSIDGRRCEAKVALPKGEPTVIKTTRIFVARIPPSVTESQFRSYFESFGKLHDAYMPRDHSKQGYRGIGFVTFTSPDSVEKIMAVKHWMNGQEIAIDRATPKEDPAALKSMFARIPLQSGQRRSFDNGAGIIGPGLTSVMHMNGSGGLSNLVSSSAMENGYTPLRAISEENTNGDMDPVMELGDSGSYRQQTADRNSGSMQAARLAAMNMGMQNGHAAAAAAAAAASANATLQSFMKAQPGLQGNSMNYNGMHSAMGSAGLQNLSVSDIQANLLSSALSKSMRASMASGQLMSQHDIGAAAMQQLLVAAAVQCGRRSLDTASAQLKRLENSTIAYARAGPRIFIGKLSKETSEADVKEYFMRFGYVMDVYMPKSKDNKAEHRGFGFVTFETESAIQRVVSHGAHRLKGATIAIDIAMPKVDDEGMSDNNVEASNFKNMGMASLGIATQRI